jgi:Holliday junction resolvase RusA-like endonuclease
MITFTIPSIPIAQPRQRHRVVTTGGKSFATNYTPSKHPVQDFRAVCKLCASNAYSGPLLQSPLCVSLVFMLPRPSSTPKKHVDKFPHVKKPDIENLCKSVMDALTMVVWHDDRQIFSLNAEKWVCGVNDKPGVIVMVKEF